jgi:type IV pilus assembly protein PilE
MKLRHSKGFTLIEIMVVVAIIGILTAIAYPAYTESVLKGRRAQARTALTGLLQQQERYLTQRNCYMAFNTTPAGVAVPVAPPAGICGGVAAANVPFKVLSGDAMANSAYVLSANACPNGAGAFPVNDCIQVVATPLQADPQVNVLTLTSTGVKGCTGLARLTRPTLCWP